ncbi:MAG: hypothetical protein FJZ90_11170 [Chloroflexi bacterium]|nr:hypothetical protein [Chloroflexota bacterium]
MACDHDWIEVARKELDRRERIVCLGSVLGGTRKHVEWTYEITYRCRVCGTETTTELITHREEPVSVSP